MGDSGLQCQVLASGHVLAQLSQQRLVSGQTPAVGLQLGLGERHRVGAEEQLQQPLVAQLVQLARGFGPPAVEHLATATGEAVAAPPPARLLAGLVEQPLTGKPLALGVELRMGHGPEVARAERRQLLEVIGGRRFGPLDQPEHDEGGLAQAGSGSTT